MVQRPVSNDGPIGSGWSEALWGELQKQEGSKLDGKPIFPWLPETALRNLLSFVTFQKRAHSPREMQCPGSLWVGSFVTHDETAPSPTDHRPRYRPVEELKVWNACEFPAWV
ncbi:uncharacterized protein LAJ45_09787 [Morchella importuna]|uniref:uncharacterized protein n=1 Tax=Morchella importuna TaxID=1174673 RepID=UPI001E8EEF0D|nr:uncharacterized protein LAJ45_09787 [Morchella importuna]KAH8146097.1 hypothetical protein LAJ45_09787 [Morchella importuna]